MKINGTAETLARVVANVALAAETDATMVNLSGVQFRRDGSEPVELAATDRYRITLATLSGVTVDGEGIYYVSAKSLVNALSMAAKGVRKGAPVTIDLANNLIEFNGSTISLETLDYKFPEYRELLPTVSDELPSGVFPIAAESLAMLGKLKFDKRDQGSWVIHFNGDTKPFMAEREDLQAATQYRVWVMPKLSRR